MSKKTAILSLGYWFSSITLGLLLHPYKTMRQVMRKRRLWVLVLTPAVWGVVLSLGSMGVILAFRLIGNILSVNYPGFLYYLVEIMFWWVWWFLVFWQVLVGYLFFRFRRVLKDR